MKEQVKMPARFKVCEGCKNFQAMFWAEGLKCKVLGMIYDGVAVCALKRGGKDGGVHGGRVPDVCVRVPDSDDDRGQG